MDFCIAAASLKDAADMEDRLIEVAEKLGVFFQFASTDEMSAGDVTPDSPLARALSRS
jgi:hypothetical protein